MCRTICNPIGYRPCRSDRGSSERTERAPTGGAFPELLGHDGRRRRARGQVNPRPDAYKAPALAELSYSGGTALPPLFESSPSTRTKAGVQRPDKITEVPGTKETQLGARGIKASSLTLVTAQGNSHLGALAPALPMMGRARRLVLVAVAVVAMAALADCSGASSNTGPGTATIATIGRRYQAAVDPANLALRGMLKTRTRDTYAAVGAVRPAQLGGTGDCGQPQECGPSPARHRWLKHHFITTLSMS